MVDLDLWRAFWDRLAFYDGDAPASALSVDEARQLLRELEPGAIRSLPAIERRAAARAALDANRPQCPECGGSGEVPIALRRGPQKPCPACTKEPTGYEKFRDSSPENARLLAEAEAELDKEEGDA